MKNHDAISGLFLTLLSAGTCIMAYRLGLGTGGNPGPGRIAFGIAFLMGLMSICLCLKGVFQAIGDHGKSEALKGSQWRKPMIVLVILVGYGIFFSFLGFAISTFLLMSLLVGVVGRQRLRLTLSVCLITVVSAYLLFVVALGVPVPSGSFWYLFGE